MPSSLPPSALGIQSAAPLPSSTSNTSSTSPPVDSLRQNGSNNSNTGTGTGNNKPRYVISSTGSSAAHPSEISTQCAALLDHIEQMRLRAQHDIDDFEQRRRDAELAEKRRVAPGWLDSETHLLQPEKREQMTQEVALMTAGGSKSWNKSSSFLIKKAETSMGKKEHLNSETEALRNAVEHISVQEHQQKNRSTDDFGSQIDKAFGNL